ncbi:MAG: hypothetical protein AB1721_00225 [Patescibacteria group bacterium]
MKIVLFSVLRKPKYFFNAIVFSFAMGLFYPLVQVAPQGLNNFWFWFSLLKPIDWLVYLVYSLVFGLSFAVFVWRNDEKICSTSKLWQSGILGSLSSFLAAAVPFCPQCLSFLAIALPTAGFSFLAQYRIWVMLGIIGLMLIALWLLGGFGRINSNKVKQVENW